MFPMQIARQQWQVYAQYHQARSDLLVHILAVPIFVLGNMALIAALAFGYGWWAALAFAVTLASLKGQELGHRGEPNPPAPFAGPADAMARILVEQWITFPRFVISGRWARAVRSAPK